MSLRRRKALIEFAESRDGYILEDDYDSESVSMGRRCRVFKVWTTPAGLFIPAL